MSRNFSTLLRNTSGWWNGRTTKPTLTPIRTKVSDCFKEIYKWKNSGNRPVENAANTTKEISQTDLTLQTVHHLERLSLVDFSNEAAIARLSSAIRHADRLKDVDTTGVQPLFSLLENESLLLREDEVTEGNQKTDVLRNAKITFEDFFVAPPGNVPLEQQKNYSGLNEETGKKTDGNLAESSVELKKARRKMK